VVWSCAVVFSLLASAVSATPFAGGNGTAATPYQIASPAQLIPLGDDPNLWDKHFVLIRDLDMAGVDPNRMNPIGGGDEGWFTGVFDGADHTITRLHILRPDRVSVGLFGEIGDILDDYRDTRRRSGGHIRNLHLKDVTIRGRDLVGGLAGQLGSGTIRDCSVAGSIAGTQAVGGLIGYSHGAITSCTATVHVRGDRIVGGLVGEAEADLTSCTATVDVGGHEVVGGLAGLLYKSSSQCSVSGRVTGESYVGGLVGTWISSICTSGISESSATPGGPEDVARIVQCRAHCSVTGSDEVGGFIGDTYGIGEIQDCYALGSVQGQAMVAGFVGHRADCCIVRCFSSAAVTGAEDAAGFIGRTDPIKDANGIGSYPSCQFIVEDITSSRLSEAERAAGIRRWREVFRPAITSCFWDAETSGVAKPSTTADDSRGITRLTKEEMRRRDVFQGQGWDFEKVWVMKEGQAHPRLRWEWPQP
jgi:hypothetical protein